MCTNKPARDDYELGALSSRIFWRKKVDEQKARADQAEREREKALARIRELEKEVEWWRSESGKVGYQLLIERLNNRNARQILKALMRGSVGLTLAAYTEQEIKRALDALRGGE